MANWLNTFLTENPAYAVLPIVRRSKRAVHFQRGDGLIEAVFTGKPIYDTATWLPIDTAIITRPDGKYGAAGVPVSIDPVDDRVSIDGTAYAQRSLRVGTFRPSNRQFTSMFTIPVGSISGDSSVATGTIGGANWEHRLRLLEDGIHETLILYSRPSISAQDTDYVVIQTQIWGKTFPDGWLNDYQEGEYQFPIPTAWSQAGRPAPVRRYARNVGGNQFIYTGIPVSWMQNPGRYPVTFDPDFAGSTADGNVEGRDVTTYATARSTSYSYVTSGTYFLVGQTYEGGKGEPGYRVFRGFLKFDTSSIGAGSTVTQVNLKLVSPVDSSVTDFDVQIVKQDWSAQDPLSDANREAAFDNCLAGTLDGGSPWRNTLSMAINTQYASPNLDTAWVNKTGNTYYSLNSSRDTGNNTPTGAEYIQIASQENATSGYRPVLTVAYTAGGGGRGVLFEPNLVDNRQLVGGRLAR